MEPADLLPLNPRDFLILFALASGERHGYGIVKDVEAGSRGQVRLDPANLYRSLKRLMRDGLVVEAAADGDAALDEDRRRYYGITALGRRVLAAEATRLAELTDVARSLRWIPASKPGSA
jgi:DNA-binding PadR family transcriptional regulator